MFDDAPPVVVADGNGVIVSQNRSARRMMGPGTGKYCWDVVGKLHDTEMLPCRRGCVLTLLAAGMDCSRQTEFKLAGKRHHISCVPVNGVVVCMLDPKSSESPNALQALSPREREVLTLLADGETSASAAAHLGVCESTVRTHVEKMRSKLGVNTRAALVAKAFRIGYLG